jgi:hypothetical protein
VVQRIFKSRDVLAFPRKSGLLVRRPRGLLVDTREVRRAA